MNPTAETTTQSKNSPARVVREILSRDEMKAFTQRSSAAGAWAVGSTWAVIAATFAGLAAFPHPATYVLAVVVLGGRQLALAILMHEGAHRTLFASNFSNDVVTDWLCAKPVWNDVARYKRHHLKHHTKTGTSEDPDLSLVTPFPTTRRSLARKFARDLLGLTAVKRVIGQILIDLEILEYTVSTKVGRRPRNGRGPLDYARALLRNSGGFLLTNAAMAGTLALFGHLWVYSAWVVANFTTFNLFLRIRSLAEHACTEYTTDPFRNTRTTRAGFLARATVAPIRVNYHLEHHLMVAVPYFRLPALHRLLRERGVIPEAPGYADVLTLVSRGPAKGAEAVGAPADKAA